MEKIKQAVQAFTPRPLDSDDEPPSEEALHELRVKGLKEGINNLLIMHLPGTITIDQAETLAIAIYDVIEFPEKYLKE